jgi:hypothetical protein
MSADNKKYMTFFVISSSGTRLKIELESLIEEIVVTQKIDAPSSFELKISDIKHTCAKESEFSIGSKITIKVGLPDALE